MKKTTETNPQWLAFPFLTLEDIYDVLTIGYSQRHHECFKGFIVSCAGLERTAVKSWVRGHDLGHDDEGASHALTTVAQYLSLVLWSITFPLGQVAASQEVDLMGLDLFPCNLVYWPLPWKLTGERDIFPSFWDDVAIWWHSDLEPIWKQEANDYT